MPVIMKENVPYAYTDKGIKAHTLSYAEYQALSTEEKMNGDLYFISDKQPEGNPSLIWDKLGTATLDTDADNVSDAVNELKSSLTDLIKVESYTYTYSINANASLNLSKTDFGISEPTGYIPLAIYRFNSGNEYVYARNVNIDPAATTVMSVHNASSSNRTNIKAYIAIAYIKSDFVVV